MQQETQKRTSYGAWKKQTPKGEVINFTLNGQRYNMWFNSKKTQEKQPDFNIYEDNYVNPNQAQPQAVQQPQQAAQQQQPQSGFVPASNGLNF
jgi:hypothetical protein